MKTFLKKFSQKTLATIGSISITLLLTSGILYSVYANNTQYYNILTNSTGNVYGPGGVNITPKGVENINNTMARLSYDISFASIFWVSQDYQIQRTCQENQNNIDCYNFITELMVLIPSGAENVKFTLKGTMRKNSEEDIGQISSPIDVNVPISECNLERCTESIPSINEISSKNIQNLNILRKLGADYSPIFSGYTLYNIEWSKDNAHPVMVNITFDFPKYSTESYIPIRAWLDDTRVSSKYSMRLNHVDHLLNFLMPTIWEIKADDFDIHGLYRNSGQCNVTRNLSRWYKMGNDINDGSWQYASTYNLHLNPSVSYLGVPHLEDLCDQSAQKIDANPQSIFKVNTDTHSYESLLSIINGNNDIGYGFKKNIINNGWVNITPIGIISRTDNYTRVKYRVDFWEINSSSRILNSRNLLLYIPKYAENIKFFLNGITQGHAQYPTPITTPSIEITESQSENDMEIQRYTQEELDIIKNNRGVTNISEIIEATGFIKNPSKHTTPEHIAEYYDTYGLWIGSRDSSTASVGSFYLEFNIPNNIDATYIPIRAFLGSQCWYEQCDDLANSYRTSNKDLPPPLNVPGQINIAIGDFDKHGLYLHQENCAVTHNSSDWWKIGQDVDNGIFRFNNIFNLGLNPSDLYTWTNNAEDLCDQAVIDISHS